MDRTPNATRVKHGCARLIDYMQGEVLRERVTEAEALACLATVLGILVAHTEDCHRDQCRKMIGEIIDSTMVVPPPEAA